MLVEPALAQEGMSLSRDLGDRAHLCHETTEHTGGWESASISQASAQVGPRKSYLCNWLVGQVENETRFQR